MLAILRHLLSILLLPFMVTVVVPRWLLGMDAAAFGWGGALALAAVMVGPPSTRRLPASRTWRILTAVHAKSLR